MNIKVLGIFQWEYHRRCCNYCTSVMFSLLGLITSSTSLTNHPKWKQMEHSDDQNVHFCICFQLWTVQLVERWKSCKRRSCIRDNLASDQNQAKSPWSMDLKLQTHYLLTPTYYEQYSRWKAKRQKQKQILLE